MVIIAEVSNTANKLPSLETISDPIRQITTENNKVRVLNQKPLLALKVSLRYESKL